MQPATGTVVREPTWVWMLVWSVFPLLGAAAGRLLVSVSGWAADERWLPFRGVFRLLDRYAATPVTVGAVAAGAAELRSELARIGVVVRDEKKRQSVRTRGGR